MKLNLTILSLLITTIGCGTGITPAKQPDSTNTSQNSPEPSSEDTSVVDPDDTSITDTGENESSDDSFVDFSDWGPHYPYGMSKETRTAAVTNCPDMEYKVYTPYANNPPVVVLGHGFARGSDVMVGWAEHLSSWGIEVLLPTLCHYNIFAGVDHEMNGQNMKELADLHTSSGVIYVGHSAGGLAAIIAAAQDPDAIGVLGLDVTDTEGVPNVQDFIGREYAGSVTSPSFSIFGEPSTCNSENNGLELFKMMEDYKAIQVTSADHCDFENPTDFACELSCESGEAEYSDDEIRPLIIMFGTAAIMSLNGSDDGTSVWSEEGLNGPVSSGIITEK